MFCDGLLSKPCPCPQVPKITFPIKGNLVDTHFCVFSGPLCKISFQLRRQRTRERRKRQAAFLEAKSAKGRRRSKVGPLKADEDETSLNSGDEKTYTDILPVIIISTVA